MHYNALRKNIVAFCCDEEKVWVLKVHWLGMVVSVLAVLNSIEQLIVDCIITLTIQRAM